MEMISVPTQVFTTKDFYLAASLCAAGTKFLRLERKNGVGYFVFTDPRKCEELTEAYFRGDLRVSAKDFVSAVRNLKDMLFVNH